MAVVGPPMSIQFLAELRRVKYLVAIVVDSYKLTYFLELDAFKIVPKATPWSQLVGYNQNNLHHLNPYQFQLAPRQWNHLRLQQLRFLLNDAHAEIQARITFFDHLYDLLNDLILSFYRFEPVGIHEVLPLLHQV